jgi:glycosyltransferase involved in cell wall biosynthesis
MRILLVTETLAIGGAETFVLRLARQLRRDGHKADVLCLNADLEDPLLVGQFPDLTIHRVPRSGLRTVKRLDRVANLGKLDLDFQQRRAARWVERNLIGRYDVHHTHLFGADWLFTRLKRRHPAMKIVATLHGDYLQYEARGSETERTHMIRWRQKLTEVLRSVDHWVTISPVQQHQFASLYGVDPARMTDIPNGYAPPSPICLATPLAPVQGETKFIMVARGIREKGWGFLVDAFNRLTGECSLQLVGAGEYLNGLRDKHGDNPRITFAGLHGNPVELIAGADVFVHPSFYKAESLPTVIVEALFVGRPVIATRVGNVATMISTASGEAAGLLISPDQATLEDQLVAAMQSYIDDRSLLDRHAALAPAAFAKFDMATCAAVYARLYERVVGA